MVSENLMKKKKKKNNRENEKRSVWQKKIKNWWKKIDEESKIQKGKEKRIDRKETEKETNNKI